MPCGPLHYYEFKYHDNMNITVQMQLQNSNACPGQNQSEIGIEYLKYIESKFEPNTFRHAKVN